jgi:hypothetical protein
MYSCCSSIADELPTIQWANPFVGPNVEDRGGKAALQGEHAVATVLPTGYDFSTQFQRPTAVLQLIVTPFTRSVVTTVRPCTRLSFAQLQGLGFRITEQNLLKLHGDQ